ncbi:MAG: hypothetical protein KJ594_04890, partial [Candidatus Omnitrophica bacterium]|nr:hypothetical protein [Candidatus Omnitrophota bacterium]
EIKLDRDKMKAGVIVDDDQLSLSIGKHGQNVRLASRLVGWELDIRTKSMIAAEALGGKTEEGPAAVLKAEDIQPDSAKVEKARKETKKTEKKVSKAAAKKETSLGELLEVSEKLVESLKEAGIKSVDDVIKLQVEGLTKIKGIGEKKAQKIIAKAKKLS